jgi:hypothetical protein
MRRRIATAAGLLLVALIVAGCSGFGRRAARNPDGAQARAAKWVDVGRYGSSGPRLGGPRYRSGGCRGR